MMMLNQLLVDVPLLEILKIIVGLCDCDACNL